MRPRTDRHTDTQTRVTTIHFSWSTTHAKCNYHAGQHQILQYKISICASIVVLRFEEKVITFVQEITYAVVFLFKPTTNGLIMLVYIMLDSAAS